MGVLPVEDCVETAARRPDGPTCGFYGTHDVRPGRALLLARSPREALDKSILDIRAAASGKNRVGARLRCAIACGGAQAGDRPA
jgi:hypothetical protein